MQAGGHRFDPGTLHLRNPLETAGFLLAASAQHARCGGPWQVDGKLAARELYRDLGFDGFVAYLESKPWGISRTRSYELIDAAAVSAVAEIPNEAQARELAPLLKRATPEVV